VRDQRVEKGRPSRCTPHPNRQSDRRQPQNQSGSQSSAPVSRCRRDRRRSARRLGGLSRRRPPCQGHHIVLLNSGARCSVVLRWLGLLAQPPGDCRQTRFAVSQIRRIVRHARTDPQHYVSAPHGVTPMPAWAPATVRGNRSADPGDLLRGIRPALAPIAPARLTMVPTVT
jgi:hypothetical protein